MYMSCVAPILDYVSHVISLHAWNELKQVQIKVAQTFLGVDKLTAHAAIIVDIGWDSCHARA